MPLPILGHGPGEIAVKKILIFGATSAIAQATARLFAAKGHAFFLVARDAEKLGAVAQDLQVRGAGAVDTALMDATDYARHPVVIEEASEQLGGLDLALIAHGTFPDQRACQASAERTREELEVNGGSVISLLTELAGQFEKQGQGTIAVLCSPAGDRGRQSNYVYGAAKAAVAIFLQGLRNRLHPAGVHVLTVKPGFVDTPMTTAFQKGILWATPETIGRGIVRAVERRKDVVYLPFFWRWIMVIIRMIPERVFKRLKL